MTRISKNALPDKELIQLRKELAKTIGSLSRTTADAFLDDLLGPEEYIMIAKRLAAILLYMEGNSSYTVWNALKISPSTADRIKLNYECGRYRQIESILKKRRADYEAFWNTLEIILRAGMPPQGRGRWKSVIKNVKK